MQRSVVRVGFLAVDDDVLLEPHHVLSRLDGGDDQATSGRAELGHHGREVHRGFDQHQAIGVSEWARERVLAG